MRTSLLLLAGAAVLYAVVTPTAALGGEWQPIKNIADPHVQGLGKCAVEEQNKVSNCGLRFAKVVSGEVQTTGGAYLLDVDALRLDGSHKVYKAEVLEQNSSSGNSACKLLSFGPGC
ncbi:unnamed protein product [Alopecurus aequalis]